MYLFRITCCCLVFCCAGVAELAAQLDTIHYLPPMHARADWGPQYLYLSTPETDPFEVSISDGSGNLVSTATISNAQPLRYGLGNTSSTIVLVTPQELHLPLKNRGLVIEGPKKFYAYFRVHANSGFHAGDLTCKGRAALGKEFRIGHVLQEVDDDNRRANFVGVLATEDSTVVTLSGFLPGTDFQVAGLTVPSAGPTAVTLQKGESVVFSTYIDYSFSIQPPNGLFGALLKASRPVAVNCGSWLAAPVMFQANDIGIDQIAPFEQVGKEYILCKGNGSSILEHPIIFAHVDDTRIWLNGAASPAITLKAGGYYIVPTSAFTADGNLYVRSSEPVFVYQVIGGAPSGDDAMRTAGLMFVPPINCGIASRVNNIFEPNRIGGMTFDGGLMVVAMRDSVVTVRIDGQPVSIGAAAPVQGHPDFVTYRHLTLFSQNQTPQTISVEAQGAVQVAMYGRNMPASFAAFFSGFSKETKPEIELTVLGDGICPDTLVASGRFDGVQWMLGDSVLGYGPDTMLATFSPGQYTAIGYLGVCRRTDYAADTVAVNFPAPKFSFSIDEPSCFGFSDGQILFGPVSNGLPPFEFSIDQGAHFSASPEFTGLPAGSYPLIVRDAVGCHGAPFALTMGQPDSFVVEIVAVKLPESLKPGQQVILAGQPNRPVAQTEWLPPPETLCPDCLNYYFRPDSTTLVELRVWDAAGCPAHTSRLIRVDPRIYVPNVIAPASFTGNDRFTLFAPEPLPIRYLRVYDRWGDLLFENTNFWSNDPQQGWDGRWGDREALPGVYVFLAEIELAPGRTELLKGSITVVR